MPLSQILLKEIHQGAANLIDLWLPSTHATTLAVNRGY